MPSTPVVVLDSTLTDIANAIRSKTGSSATMTPSEMPAQIMSISPVYETTSTTGAFYTDMVTPLEKLLVSFMPKQSGSGTPSLSNIRPIVGWTSLAINHNGKNLFDKDKPLVQSKYISADGSIGTLNGYQYSDYYTPVNPNAGYIFSGTFGGTAYNTISFYDVDKNFIGRYVPSTAGAGAQFTTPSNCCYIRFSMAKTADLSTIQLEVGSTATTYEAYRTSTHTSALGQTAYGGTLDLSTGVLTVTYKTLQSTSWRTPTTTDTKNRWVIGMSIPDAWTELRGKMWAATTDYYSACDRLEKKREADAQEGEATFAIYGHTNSVEWRIRIPNTYTAAEAKAIADASTLCYLCEPQTYQLTPQQIKPLTGNNTLTLDGGEVTEVIYLTHLLPDGYQADGNLVACYRSSDDALGIYDLVNNVFYANAETSNLSVASNTLHANAGIDDLSVASDVLHTDAETGDFPAESDV